MYYIPVNGKKEAVKYLLEHKADDSVVNAKEQLAIDYTNIKGFNEVTELILETKGAAAPTSVAAEPTNETTKPDTGAGMADKNKALLNLKVLLDVGILTQEEFDAEKTKILKG